jgi:protein-tyrosine phosphatase
VFWIEMPGSGRLAIAARPRAGDWLNDEIKGWRLGGVDEVVSLLEPHEIYDLELDREGEACAQAGIAFRSFPISDRGVPSSLAKTQALVADCKSGLSAGRGILVHCRAGIGRSALVVACVLVSLGDRPEAAFARIKSARGLDVPDTLIQTQWVDAFADA